jgi:hypothetical protein
MCGESRDHTNKLLLGPVSEVGSEPFVDGRDVDGGLLADGEFVVAGGHGSVALEPVDQRGTGRRPGTSGDEPWLHARRHPTSGLGRTERGDGERIPRI